MPRSKSPSTSIVVQELKEIQERVESLIETFEISSDKEFMKEIKRSLKEAQKGRGRPIKEIIAGLEKGD